MRFVTKFEIVDLGVDSPSYFQGFGYGMTEFDASVTGIGYDAVEAYDDALEQMATMGVETDTMPKRPKGIRKSSKVLEHMRPSAGFDEGSFYYVGIRYSQTAEIDANEDDGRQYDIVRYYAPTGQNRLRSPRVQQTCLTLGQARVHCNDPRTRGATYFDGYTKH